MFYFGIRHFTPRLVRATLEEQFQLDEGTLGIAEYKSAIKAATKAALVRGLSRLLSGSFDLVFRMKILRLKRE